MFIDWLDDEYYLRLFLELSKIPHYITLQKFTDGINIMMLEREFLNYHLYKYKTHIYLNRCDRIQINSFIRAQGINNSDV
ncbi:MAG TPA: hypothetical protein VFM31_07585 [Nitrososphaeraceae archaeon]|jgi:hypothetical protein|nr:hypothetical protein [Nitrososphaeraceae archaeon]